MQQDASPSEERVVAADGQALIARFYAPEGVPTGAVLLVPAMGVAQVYYAPIARWLAANVSSLNIGPSLFGDLCPTVT
jgi:predicted alpha/beta hydrolase